VKNASSRIGKGLIALAAIMTAGAGVSALAAGGGGVCPAIYAPVKCADGKTYTNSCWASLAGQTNCTPVGPRGL